MDIFPTSVVDDRQFLSGIREYYVIMWLDFQVFFQH